MTKDTKIFLGITAALILAAGLFTLLFMPEKQSRRTLKKYQHCAGNLKAIHAALLKYKEQKGTFPAEADTAGMLPIYKSTLHDLNSYICPATTTHTREQLRDDTLSYYYFPAGETPDPELPAVTDHPGNHPDLQLGISWSGELRAFRTEGSGRDAVLKAWKKPSQRHPVPGQGSQAAE